MAAAKKILAIQFKYLGDAVFITPALRAIKEYRPDCELHVLVSEDVAPLLEHVPWLTKVWAMPRTRGHARFRESLPVIRALRRERFDRSVDFAGNDRGAILSWLCGARERLGPSESRGFWGRKKCYNATVPGTALPDSWVQRHLQLLAAWQISPPKSWHLEINASPALAEVAARLLPDNCILCHIAASHPKKEWLLPHWIQLYHKAGSAGHQLVFSAGPGHRERALLDELKRMEPALFALPPVTDLGLFLAVLKRARLVIAGDTGPLHFAAGLGVPVVGLFATEDSVLRALPIYEKIQKHSCTVTGGPCTCQGDAAACDSLHPCMASISPNQVFDALMAVLETTRPSQRLETTCKT
jgi:ADP-heptose:LPS heptosyltransferase